MVNVNGHRYQIDAQACLRAYFMENIGWHSISGSREFTHEERSGLFGPDVNLKTMRIVRMSPEWIDIVTAFAQENGLDVEHSISKAIVTTRGPQPKTKKAQPAKPSIENEVVQAVCTQQAETESDVKDIQRDVNSLAGMVLEAFKRIETLEDKVFDLEMKEDRTYQLVPVDTE